MGILLELLVNNDDQTEADGTESQLREAIEPQGGTYFGTEDNDDHRIVRFLFDTEESADAALAAIDTSTLEVRRHETHVEMVDPKELRPGPIRHESLPDELAALARFSYQRIGKRMYPAYEQWELGFLRDMHPAGEIALWVRMGYAMERYLARHPDEDEEDVFKDLLSLSVGAGDGTARKEELKSLIEAVSAEDFEEAIRLGS